MKGSHLHLRTFGLIKASQGRGLELCWYSAYGAPGFPLTIAENSTLQRAEWYTPVIPQFTSLRQGGLEFEAILG